MVAARRHARRAAGATPGAAVPTPLDIDPAHRRAPGPRARGSRSPPRATPSTCGEAAPDGGKHVFSRRDYDITLGGDPQDATLDAFEGGAGGAAHSPDIDVEPTARTPGSPSARPRRTLALDRPPPARRRPSRSAALDGGVATAQRHLTMTSAASGWRCGDRHRAPDNSGFSDDMFEARPASTNAGGGVRRGGRDLRAQRLGARVAGRRRRPRPARARAPGARRPGVLSRAALGPAAPGEPSASSNRVGDVAVAVLQGAAGQRSVGVAMYDHPPSRPGLPLDPARGRAAAADPLDAGAGVGRPARSPC